MDVSPRTYSSSKQKKGVSYAYLTRHSPDALRMYALVLLIATCVACPFLAIEWCILTLVFSSCVFGAIASLWLSRSVLQCDDGTPEMREVSDPIREGAEGFLKVQYTAIAKFAIPLAILIVISYQFRPHSQKQGGVALLGNTMLGVVAALGFCFGAVCSATAGYVSMWVATLSNIRVASAARRSYGEALVVCFRGGAFSAVLNLTLCITGTLTLKFTIYCNHVCSLVA
jgi:inorganic pyrophosphatase